MGVSPGRDVSPRAIRPSEDLDRAASPVKLRMMHLSNRLAGLQDELDAEKKTTVDDKNIKRMRIEHRYTKPRLPMPTGDDRITMLADQVAVCRKELADLIASREDFEDQSTKVVKAVENHINLDLTVEKRARKDLEAKMLKYAEDLVGSLSAQTWTLRRGCVTKRRRPISRRWRTSLRFRRISTWRQRPVSSRR